MIKTSRLFYLIQDKINNIRNALNSREENPVIILIKVQIKLFENSLTS